MFEWWRIIECRSGLEGWLEHLPKIKLRAQGEIPRSFQQLPEGLMLGARCGERSGGGQIKVRQRNPRLFIDTRTSFPGCFDTGEIGEEID